MAPSLRDSGNLRLWIKKIYRQEPSRGHLVAIEKEEKKSGTSKISLGTASTRPSSAQTLKYSIVLVFFAPLCWTEVAVALTPERWLSCAFPCIPGAEWVRRTSRAPKNRINGEVALPARYLAALLVAPATQPARVPKMKRETKKCSISDRERVRSALHITSVMTATRLPLPPRTYHIMCPSTA